MSINNDDEYDLDDEILDDSFEEDLEAGLDDFDEEMSFDEDEAIFEEDDELNQLANQESLGGEKKKFNIDIGFDKIAIIGAVLIGIIVLVFQVSTKTAEQKVEVFQSVLTMKGATDGEVFGENQSKNIATVAPEKKESDKAFLYEAESLNDLPDNLKDGEIVSDVEITPSDEKIIAKKDQSGEFLAVGQSNQSDDLKGEFVDSSGKTNPAINITSIPLNPMDQVESPPAPKTQPVPISEEKKELKFVPIEQVVEKKKSDDSPPVMQTPSPAPRVVETPTENSAASQVNQGQDNFDDIKSELLALKAEVEKLKNEKVELQKKVDVKNTGNSEKTQEMSGEISKPEIKAPSVSTPKKQKPRPASPAAETVTTWQLRAAQPGKAWISPMGKRDMIAVSVGDTVKGLGKVVAITNKDGKWVIVGTEGQIKQ